MRRAAAAAAAACAGAAAVLRTAGGGGGDGEERPRGPGWAPSLVHAVGETPLILLRTASAVTGCLVFAKGACAEGRRGARMLCSH